MNTQAGTTATYAEMVQRTVDYADAAKDVNPDALIFGPVNYGWQGMVRFQDAADASNRDFLEFYLAADGAPRRPRPAGALVDVLDVHWYPEAQGNARHVTRITEDNTDAGGGRRAQAGAAQALGPDIHRDELDHAVLLGRAHPAAAAPQGEDRRANYPGTKLAITEYNYGGANHISGGIAQADVLGIFGREGLFAANAVAAGRRTTTSSTARFEMFRNYDGANGSFGDTSIRATNSDVANASVYASVDAGNAGRMVIVAHQQGRHRADRGHRRHPHRAVQHRAGVRADQRQLGAAAARRTSTSR